ncbi:MAG TPA: zinc-binding dehydrogenase [Candidatus Eisenbacteria bacterium]|nr:zinc-binding dehydrogenase [Candidatus Eisenbacteria bacterium]
MRAVWIPRPGPPEVLEVREGPDPVPKADQVLVRVRAAGINFADVAARLGVYPDAPPPPCVVGYEVAGVVEQAGPDVHTAKVGDRVFALTRFGGYADAIAVPAPQVFSMPAAMAFEEAAAIPVNYLTAILMLRYFGNVKEGERVLVHAAAGGVGMAAIQLCRIAGAEVIGTASAAKHATLKEMGVAHCIDYRTEDFEQGVKRVTGGRGVDIALDAIGAFRKSYRCLAPLGRLVCFGLSQASSGMAPSRLRALLAVAQLPWFHPIKLMNDNKAVIGVNLGHLWDHMGMLRREMIGLLADYDAGRIKPIVGKTFPLVDAAKAHRFMQERQNVGKVVLTC